MQPLGLRKGHFNMYQQQLQEQQSVSTALDLLWLGWLSAAGQGVRRNGGGFFLVLHALHPTGGRPDFAAWIMSRQHMAGALGAQVATPFSASPGAAGVGTLKLSSSKSKDMASRAGLMSPKDRNLLLGAQSLRQMSIGLGGPKHSATLSPAPPAHTTDPVLAALANLGLSMPAAQPAAKADSDGLPAQQMKGITDKVRR
jgi:hypothetical protein